MGISDQIDALQQRAADLKSSFDQSTKETSEQVKERLGQAKADIEARQDAVKAKAGHAAGPPPSQWAAMKARAAARQAAFRDTRGRTPAGRATTAAERGAQT